MAPVKIVFFDVDGTLIDMQKGQMSEKTIFTLMKLREKGIRICLATGRPPVILPVVEGLEFDACVTFNGSLCYAKENIVYDNPIPPKTVDMLLANAAKLGKPVSAATRDRVVANGRDDDMAQYYAFSHNELKVAEDFDEVIRQPVYQVMSSCRESEYPQLLQGTESVKIAAWWDRACDVIPAAGGKGNGIQAVLDYFRLRPEEALAFGDGNNDLDMFQVAGTGVAMANASDRLKAAATEICGHVAEDGVYHYCRQKGLI